MQALDADHAFTTAGSLPVLRWPGLDATGAVDAVVTTRHGGVSLGDYASLNLGLHVGDETESVIENRSRVADALDLALDDLVFCRQTHSRAVVEVDRADRGRGSRSEADAIANADVLVTADPAVGLVVMVADCVPLVIVDPVARLLACVHAGWKGTTLRVSEAAVQRLVEMGAEPACLVVGMGPAISAQRYQVGDDVAAAARDAFGARARELVSPDGTGRWLFDLWAANRLVLLESGVAESNVHIAAIGTESDRFFSDRAVRPCGRFAAIARLTA